MEVVKVNSDLAKVNCDPALLACGGRISVEMLVNEIGGWRAMMVTILAMTIRTSGTHSRLRALV